MIQGETDYLHKIELQLLRLNDTQDKMLNELVVLSRNVEAIAKEIVKTR